MVQPARQKETTKEDSADQEEDLHWLTSLARSIPLSESGSKFYHHSRPSATGSRLWEFVGW